MNPWIASLFVVVFAPGAAGADLAAAQGAACGAERNMLPIKAAHLQSLNAIRKRQSLSTLSSNSLLSSVAQDYACLLARTGHFDHTGPDGSTPATRVAQGGYKYCLVAENLALGQRSVREALQAWVNSPRHRENIVLRDAVDVGLGLAWPMENGADGTDGAPRPESLSALAAEISDDVGNRSLMRRAPVWVQLFAEPC